MATMNTFCTWEAVVRVVAADGDKLAITVTAQA